VVAYDWGLDQAPHPVSAGRDERVDQEPDRLPEVRLLVGEGWRLAPDAPVFAFLPAVWPARLRTWVPDRAARYEERSVMDPGGGRVRRTFTVAWSDDTREDIDDDVDWSLGRLWLLKPPEGFASVDAFLDHVEQRAREAGTDFSSAEYVELTARELAKTT
jgi:hypothetical protein